MDLGADAGVERAERFVEQQHARLHDQRLGKGEALLACCPKAGPDTLGLRAGEADFGDEPARFGDRLATGREADETGAEAEAPNSLPSNTLPSTVRCGKTE